MNDDPRRNASGYFDFTAYKAIKNIEREERMKKMEDRCVCCGEIIPEGTRVCPTHSLERYNDEERFRKLLHTIFTVCELADFKIDGRIALIDKKTGKVWK